MKKLFLFSIPSLFFLSSGTAQQNWDGDNAVGNFSFLNNWFGNALPTWSSATDLTFYFNNGGQTSMYYDLPGWQVTRSIFYASSYPSSLPLDGNGNGLDFYNKIENNSSFGQTINIPLSFKGTAMEINSVNGDITFNNIVYNNNNINVNVWGNNSKLVTFNNYIGGGSASLTINQYSRVAIGFNNAASFSGNANVNNGELWIKAGAVLNSANIKIGNGNSNTCKLYISDPSTATSVANAIIVPANSTNSYIGGLNTTNTHNYSGDISLLGPVNLDALNIGGTINFSGKLFNGGDVTKINPGTVILSGTVQNTYGSTLLSGGTLVLNKSAGLRALGSGTTTIGGGTVLRTDAANQWGVVTPALTTINGNGILNANGFDQKVAVTSTSTTASLTLGAATVTNDWIASNSFDGVISGPGNVIKTNSATWTLNGANTYSGSTTVNDGILKLSHPGGNTLSPASSVSVTGTGTLQLTEDQTITNFTMNAGTLVVPAGRTLTITGAYTVSGGTINNSGTIKLAGGSTSFPGTSVIVNNGTANTMANLEVAGFGTVTLTAGIILNNLVLTSGTLDASASNYNLTIANDWINNGGSFTPHGNTVTFTGGGTRIIAGTAVSQAFNNITVSLNSASTTLGLAGATIALILNGNLTITSGKLLGSNHSFTIGGNWINYNPVGFTESTSTVDFNDNGAQSIATAGGEDLYILNKSGTGTTTLGSNVNFAGSGSALNISGGILDAGTYSLNGTAATSLIMSAGILKLGTLSPTTEPEFAISSYSLTGNSTIELNGAGAQTLKGSKDYRNLTFSNSGTKTVTSAPASITGTITVANNVTLDVANNTMGGLGTNLILTGTSRYRTEGTGTKPDAQGTYTLAAGTTMDFANIAATQQDVRLSPIYSNIEVSGSNVGNASSVGTPVTLQPGRTFSVKGGATFFVASVYGFSGAINTAINITNSPAIVLATNSVIGYNGASQLVTNTIPYKNLILSGTGNKTAPAATLEIQGDLLAGGTAAFVHNGGTVLLDGGNQSFAGLTYNNLWLDNAGTKTLAGNAIILDSFKIGNLGSNQAITLELGNYDLTLKSTAFKTAKVGAIATAVTISYNGTGRFVAERFFKGLRSWRVITLPLTSKGTPNTSIFDTWQNSGIYEAGKGMFVTGPGASNPTPAADGLDWSDQNNFSLKRFANNNYVGIGNTKDSLVSGISDTSANVGYFAFVRGDRSRSPNNTIIPNTNTTTLSGRGKLQTGRQTFPVNIDSVSSFTLIGNPYPCPVDFNLVTKNNVYPNRFVAYDPTINTVGVFVVMEDGGSGTFLPLDKPTSAQDNFIQSGQAFFVQPNSISAPANLVFNESNKSVTSNNSTIFRPLGVTSPSFKTILNKLYDDNSTSLADGVHAQFDSIYKDAVEVEDAVKFSNIAENLALVRYGKALAVEKRPLLAENDTLFYKLTKTTQRKYQLRFIPNGLDPLLNAFLEDSYTGTSTPVSVIGNSIYNFGVNSDAASAGPGRFRIVFRTGTTVPVTYSSIKAYQQSGNIAVEWTVQNELNISKYEIEKSADAITFSRVRTITATGAIRGNTSYTWLDVNALAGDNFYRIRSMDLNGKTTYSSIVNVRIGMLKAGISVYPNPVSDGNIGLQLNNMPAGLYEIRLINNVGQIIRKQLITYRGGSAMETIMPAKILISGTYQLEIITSGRKKDLIKILVK